MRADQLGARFRRQYVLQMYIVDFECLPLYLVVEVDGGVHDSPEAVEADALRTKGLLHLGYQVVRFRNEEVLEDVGAVCKSIISEMEGI